MTQMIIAGGLHLKREGDALILRSTNGGQWFGAFFSGFAVFWLIGLTILGAGGFSYWFGLLIGVTLVVVGLVVLLPREITTIFDPRSRRVLHNVSLCKGWYERRQPYSFDEIAGLGVKEYAGEGYAYVPVLVLRGGRIRWLAEWDGGYLAFTKTMDEVCGATGLPRLDIPPRFRGRDAA
jgi:hypothetical protein